VVNVANLLTLRYDPDADHNKTIREISFQEVLSYRQASNQVIPSFKDVETALRKEIRTTIVGLGPDRISMAISTGIDSNVVFCLVKKEFPDLDINCLTVAFDNEDDSKNEAIAARRIAQTHDANFEEIVVYNPLKDLPLQISIVKEPRWNIYQYYFIEKASRISKVLFTGDGGDELFGGYTFRYKKFIDNLNLGSSWLDRVRLYLICHERDWVTDQELVFGPNVKFSWSSIYRILKKYFDNALEPLEQVLLADYHGKLMHDFIPANQRYFSYFDINGVAPLLSHDVISLSTKIPATMKYDHETNTGKIQLREIIRRAGSSKLSSLVEDKKMGFSIDLTRLWTNYGRDIVTANLDRARIFEDKLINRDWYIKTLHRIDEDKYAVRDISKMLQLLSLEIWYKLFVTSEISAKSCL
jgi:asparagine synthase (glutamine-hydrolysing)